MGDDPHPDLPGRSFETEGNFGPREMVTAPVEGEQNPAYMATHVHFPCRSHVVALVHRYVHVLSHKM